MKTKRWDNFTDEEKTRILNSPGGLDRVLHLLEKTSEELKNQIKNTWSQIKNKEDMAVSWMSLLVVLALLQVVGFEDSTSTKAYLIASLPSFIIAFFTAAYTLIKHPNYLRTDFFIPEKEDKHTRYELYDSEIKMLQDINKSLVKNYNRKKKYSGFIGPAIIANFLVSVTFIILTKIFELKLLTSHSVILAIVSIFIIFIMKKQFGKGSFSQTFRRTEEGKSSLETINT